MKKPSMNIRNPFSPTRPRRIILPLLTALAMTAFTSMAQTLPVVKVRFANPTYDCATHRYCLDVEFQSDTPNKQLFGINLRLFYDDDQLEYFSTGDYAQGYSSPAPPQLQTGPSGSGVYFGFPGPAEWLNGAVQKTGTSTVFISTTGWTKLFNMCFLLEDPGALLYDPVLCPPIVWDLQQNPANGGFFPGDDGVVITLVLGSTGSSPTTENVVQFNWVYQQVGNSFGHPEEIQCITTECWVTPVADWAIYLAIGLMAAASVFLYRRRIAG